MVQTDRCMTSVPYVFETLSRYFESKQYRNPGQDVTRKNGTYGHPITAITAVPVVAKPFPSMSAATINKVYLGHC